MRTTLKCEAELGENARGAMVGGFDESDQLGKAKLAEAMVKRGTRRLSGIALTPPLSTKAEAELWHRRAINGGQLNATVTDDLARSFCHHSPLAEAVVGVGGDKAIEAVTALRARKWPGR